MKRLNTMMDTITRKTRLSTRIKAVKWFAAGILITSLILILSAAETIETIGILAALGRVTLGVLGFGIGSNLLDEMVVKEREAIDFYKRRAWDRRMKNIVIDDSPSHDDGLVIGWDHEA